MTTEEHLVVCELDAGSKRSSSCYGFEVTHVEHVVETATAEPVPLSPGCVVGIFTYGGRIITIVDPAMMLGHAVQGGVPHHVLVLRTRGGSAGNLGLKVARIHQIVPREALTGVQAPCSPYVKRVMKSAERLIHEIDVTAFRAALMGEFRHAGDMTEGASQWPPSKC